MNHRTIDKTELYEFSDILDFTEFANSVPDDNYSKTYTDNRWAGGTFEDAVKQARNGNSELVKEMFDGVNILSSIIEEEKVGEIRDVTGEYFDVADYLSGEPEVFRRDEYVDQRMVVPVYANFAMHCAISKKTILNRGCAIVALCDELRKSGFIVDLHLVHCVEYNDKRYMTNISVQLDPLDLDTAAFIIANPLCLRRLWFAALEAYTEQSSCGGYGRPSEYDSKDIFDSGLSGFYFVSSLHGCYHEANYRTVESAKTHVLSMIEKFKESAEQVILG